MPIHIGKIQFGQSMKNKSKKKEQTIQNKIISRGLKAIPNFVWVICASYSLIVISTVLALNFAHIDADKHINRYFDIMLSKQESANPNKCNIQFNERLKAVEELAHHSQ